MICKRITLVVCTVKRRGSDYLGGICIQRIVASEDAYSQPHSEHVVWSTWPTCRLQTGIHKGYSVAVSLLWQIGNDEHVHLWISKHQSTFDWNPMRRCMSN